MNTDRGEDERLVREFLDAVEGLSQREVGKKVEGVTQKDVSRWQRNDWEYLTAAKRRALRRFLTDAHSELGVQLPGSDLADPAGSPAERLIHHLTHPEIVRRFADHPPRDFVKAAFAYALEEDFPAEEMEKLEAWRQAVTGGEANPE